MEHDAWFFIGVFVFIFLIWIATGGPLHPLAFNGPTLAEPGALGGGTYLSLPRAPYAVDGSGNVSLPGSSGDNSVSGSSGVSQTPSLPGGIAFGDISPYRGVVLIDHYISGAGSTPKGEFLELSISQSAKTPIDISGWTLRSDASGNSTPIPRGTEVPAGGTVNAAQDIILSAGDHATIISGQSPIGASFRENKCIGYFGNFQSFSPVLPLSCPVPSTELSTLYGTDYIRDTTCIEYVNMLSRCQAVLSPPSTLSGTCQSFIVKYFNYNGCVDAHKSDTDFKGDRWRIYLGRTSTMWQPRHEIVRLLDAQCKTVDAFSY